MGNLEECGMVGNSGNPDQLCTRVENMLKLTNNNQ